MREWMLWLIGRKEMIELDRWRVEWEEHRRWMAEFELARATLDHMRGRVEGHPMNSMMNLRDSFRSPPASQSDEPITREQRTAALQPDSGEG